MRKTLKIVAFSAMLLLSALFTSAQEGAEIVKGLLNHYVNKAENSGNTEKWAAYENKLFFLEGNGENVAIYSKNVGDNTFSGYENIISIMESVIGTGKKNLYQLNWCTNFESLMFEENNKMYKYICGSFINNTRYKKDMDVFVAKVNLSEKNMNKKIVWSKELSYQNENGNTDDKVQHISWAGDSGCVVVVNNSKTTAESKGNYIIRFDKAGNIRWNIPIKVTVKKYNLQDSNSYIGEPSEIIPTLDGNIIAVFNRNGKWDSRSFPSTSYPYMIFKFNLQNGEKIWEKDLFLDCGVEVSGPFGGIVELKNNDFMLVFNYRILATFDKNDKPKIQMQNRSFSFETKSNICLLKLDHNGNFKDLYHYPSDEPRYINRIIYSSSKNLIYCYGRRGELKFFSKGINTYKREDLKFSYRDTNNANPTNKPFSIDFDVDGKIIRSDGQE